MSASPRLKAPQQDGAVLAVPALSAVGELLSRNQRLFDWTGVTLLGRPLVELRRLAREELVRAAGEYLASAGEPVPADDGSPLILAGHQPELFHPGVWIKNFALAGLARQHGLTAVNLLVDSDTAKTTAVRVPSRDCEQDGQPGKVHLTSVPFDQLTTEVAYEERLVRDESLFASFADRAGAELRPWSISSMLPAFWDEVLKQARRTPLLGERLVAARRTFERPWGCHNFELPISRLCGTEAFAWFACSLLANIDRFAVIHNAALHDYRRRHRIRSKNHPVPELAHQGDWHEAPFWAWRAGQNRRNRLFVRIHDGGINLRSGDEAWPRVRLAEPAAMVADWRLLERQGLKVRTRALTTTLFARLVAGELFIHGIGGGTYDELTDEIIRRYFGIEPPGFVILSGTLLLPLPSFPDALEKKREVHRIIRSLHWNPDRQMFWLSDPFPQLVAEKEKWIKTEPGNRQERRERFEALRGLNRQMRIYTDKSENEWRGTMGKLDAQLAINRIVQRRDYAFCLFPEAKIKDFCTQFLQARRM